MLKAEELKILDQVRKLIEPTWYVKAAFAGVLDYAERNIADDAAYNPVEELEKAYKDGLRKDAEMGNKLIGLEHERDTLADNVKAKDAEIEKLGHLLDSKVAECVEQAKQIGEMRRDANGCESCIKDLREEIIRLKAEIYDLRKEREQK